MNFKEYLQSISESSQQNIEKILSKIFKSSEDYEIDTDNDVISVQIYIDKSNIKNIKQLFDTFVLSFDDMYFDDATDEFVLEFDDSNPRDGQAAEAQYMIYFSDLLDIKINDMTLKEIVSLLQNDVDEVIMDNSTKTLLNAVRNAFGGLDEDSAKILIKRIAENL